jgi:predicted secreted Zn-dependent protease
MGPSSEKQSEPATEAPAEQAEVAEAPVEQAAPEDVITRMTRVGTCIVTGALGADLYDAVDGSGPYVSHAVMEEARRAGPSVAA